MLGIAVAAGIALVLAQHAGVVGVGAVPAVVRTVAVGCVLFGVCGYAATRTLLARELGADSALLVLPVGAAISALSLAVLGLLHVPLKVSLAIVLALGAIGAARRLLIERSIANRTFYQVGVGVRRVAVPVMLATLVGLVSLVPIFRSGFATVPGQNGDAILVVGTAVLLEHAPPTATRNDLPISRIPLEWRSKYPIYYPLAAVSALGDQDPIAAFASFAALILALTALGFYLFARYALRAPPAAALLGMFVVPLDRIVMYVTMHPYYNELWGQFTLPFILLAGCRYLDAPDRRRAGVLVLFLVLGLLAYPLMLPFPAIFLLGYAAVVWRRERRLGRRPGWISALRLPGAHVPRWIWIPAAVVVAVPVALVLVRGFLEKTVSAFQVLAPWTSLQGWHGSALGFTPWPEFVGMPSAGVLGFAGLAAVCLLAWRGLMRVDAQARWPLAAMVVATALIGVYFRLRTDGELFYFKDVAFLGPYVLLLALIELVSLAMSPVARRWGLGLAGIVAALIVVPASASREIGVTFDQATPWVLQLRDWNRQLPRDSSVRIDVPASGWQLWVTYMLTSHPLCAVDPLGGIFPHPPPCRKADYVIALVTQPRPPDAVGRPLLRNAQFQLWRMNPALRGPEIRSRQEFFDISQITIGG